MPKKICTNSKALEARERIAETKKAANEKSKKDAEDRLWQDDDKNLAKKNAKRIEEEQRKAELLRKKAENKALLETELAAIKTTAKPSIQKVTQAQIQQETEKRNRAIERLNAKPTVSRIFESYEVFSDSMLLLHLIQSDARVVRETPQLEENINRLMTETTVATTVEEAIAVLKVSDDPDQDKHPEKRMKAAFKAFEAVNLPRIKAENPSMRLSQWKQQLFREWQKSPENPLFYRN